MKKVFLLSLLTSGLVVGSFAYADSQNASIGYAQSKVKDFKDIKGVNLKYRYEWDDPISVIGSATYMKGNDSFSYKGDKTHSKHKADVKYISFLAGSAYRINPLVSLYGLVGVAYIKSDANSEWHTHRAASTEVQTLKGSSKKTSFAYGAGIEINPIDDFVINLGYEGTIFKMDKNYPVNGFNLGVGYRF